MDFKRLFRHLLISDLSVKRAFPVSAMRAIEAAINESEAKHSGEIRFAVEVGLDLVPLLRGMSARQRAIEVFSRLRIWDTEHNSGVLIYLLLADRDIEIVADRGINARVGQDEWNAICTRMETAFKQGQFEQEALAGIREISTLLTKHFPAQTVNPDELPDKPVVL